MSLIDVKKKLLMAQKGGVDVSVFFNISLWEGTGATRTITTGIDSGEGSMVWIKQRNIDRNNILSDTFINESGLSLSSNTTGSGLTGRVTGFNPTGYYISNNVDVNSSAGTYVGWQFRRAEKFFDVVQYTGNGVAGRQIAHNLGVKPGLMIVKCVDVGSRDWTIYHQSTGAGNIGIFTSSAFSTSNSAWAYNNTEPTDTDFTLGSGANTNQNTRTYIAYLFAHDPSPEGLIQCGSYVGSGAAGNNINLGWRPQYLMVKNASNAANWHVFDAARGLAGPSNGWLYPNLSSAEDVIATASSIASNANGFQLNAGGNAINASGNTYIYMAIREAA